MMPLARLREIRGYLERCEKLRRERNALILHALREGRSQGQVACAPGLTAGAMVRQSGWIRNNAVRLSTVGQVRAIGHDVIPSGKFPHADLKLCEEPSDALWEELRSVFSAPIKKSELPS